MFEIANPVSYTHLDVYKRQVLLTPCSVLLMEYVVLMEIANSGSSSLCCEERSHKHNALEFCNKLLMIVNFNKNGTNQNFAVTDYHFGSNVTANNRNKLTFPSVKQTFPSF